MSENPYLQFALPSLFMPLTEREDLLGGGRAWPTFSDLFTKASTISDLRLGHISSHVQRAIEVNLRMGIGTTEGLFIMCDNFFAWKVKTVDLKKPMLEPQTPEDFSSLGYVVKFMTQEEFVHKKYFKFRQNT